MSRDAPHLHRLRGAIPELHRWFEAARRDLPWRRTRDPYAIWISEVMLQQTRVATVLPYYEAWMTAFPDLTALAAAPEDRVLSAWEGLGYYGRARNLHRAARDLVERFGGRIPDDPRSFAALPGVGPYTVAAVMSIAFDRDLAVIDGNVRRVLSRLVALEHDPRRRPGSSILARLASDLLPVGTAALHNQAMMELGALVCSPRAPACSRCPMQGCCRARASGETEAYPRSASRGKLPHHDVVVGIVLHGGRLLINRRPYRGFLGGLWELPKGRARPGEPLEQALVRGIRQVFGMTVQVERPLPPVRHAYSHFKITLHPRVCRPVRMGSRAAEGPAWEWVELTGLDRYPISRADRNVIEKLPKRSKSITI